MARRSYPAWVYVAAVGIAAATPVLLLGSYLLYAFAQQERARLEAATEQMVQEIRARLTLELDRHVAVAETLAASGRLAGADPMQLEAHLRRFTETERLDVVMRDGDGRILLHTAVAPGAEPPAVRDTTLDRQVREADRSVVSDLIRDQVTGEPAVAVTARMERPGRGPWFVSVVLPAALIGGVFNGVALPPSAVIGIVDRTGILVTRSREHDRFVGRPGTPELLTRMRAQTEGRWTGVGLDGLALVAAFSREPVSQWGVVAAVELAQVEEPVERFLAQAALLAALSVTLSAALAWFASRFMLGSVRWLTALARQVGQGPWPHRDLAVRELDAVAQGLAAADAGIREQAARNLLLTRELHHRIKNLLATVQAVANATLRSSPDLETFREAFEGRLVALARSQAAAGDGEGPARVSLPALLREELAVFGDGVAMAGPEVAIPAPLAAAVGLAIHELSTNAAKHGALAGDGRVAVGWRIADGRLVLDWCESGGPPVQPPARKGFGTQLLQAVLVRQHGAEVALDYPPEGARARIVLPLG